jgi:low temperature requirement protein LtrA
VKGKGPTVEIEEKKVELIELFYDLIYVYAISRLTTLVEEPEHGVIPVTDLLRWLVVCLVILQAWLYLTNYVNRYGEWRWWEYLLTGANMFAAVYMSNTISRRWDEMSGTFNLAMLAMLACVALMYAVRAAEGGERAAAARNSITILLVDCLLYLCAFVASLVSAGTIVVWLDVAAVVCGAFLPFFLRGSFDYGIINFPHLAERFELLTIITFGEGVVGMTGFFDPARPTLRPVLVFLLIALMYGGYVLQLHVLSERRRVDRALRLMFSHYLIVMAVNLVTVSLLLLENSSANRTFVAVLMLASLAVFYAAMYADSVYYRPGTTFTGADGSAAVMFLLVGGAVMLLPWPGNGYGVLTGALTVAAGNFVMLERKRRLGLRDTHI